jgi:hypothetical protein
MADPNHKEHRNNFRNVMRWRKQIYLNSHLGNTTLGREILMSCLMSSLKSNESNELLGGPAGLEAARNSYRAWGVLLCTDPPLALSLAVFGLHSKQVWDKILKNITGDWQVVCACNPCYSGGGGRRITVQGQSGQKHETLSETPTKSERTRGRKGGVVAQVIERLCSKLKALSSIPSTAKKKKILVGRDIKLSSTA